MRDTGIIGAPTVSAVFGLCVATPCKALLKKAREKLTFLIFARAHHAALPSGSILFNSESISASDI